MSTTKSRIHYWLAGLILGLFVAGGTHFVLAWTAPGTNPPNGNVSGPITTSSVDQEKVGSFEVTGFGKSITAPSFCLPGVAPTGGCINTWPTGGSSPWTESGTNVYYNGGNVGIGLTNPSAPLHVAGNGGTLEFAGSYNGAENWPNFVGAVVKDPITPAGNAEVAIGVGGSGGESPGIAAYLQAGGRTALFVNSLRLAIWESTVPAIVQTSRLGVGIFNYSLGDVPAAGAELHVKGDVLANSFCLGDMGNCINDWSSGSGGGGPVGGYVHQTCENSATNRYTMVWGAAGSGFCPSGTTKVLVNTNTDYHSTTEWGVSNCPRYTEMNLDSKQPVTYYIVNNDQYFCVSS